MPCYDPMTGYAQQVGFAVMKQQEEDMKKGILPANVLLCSACRSLERMGYDFDENPALSLWWDNHKKEDAEHESK